MTLPRATRRRLKRRLALRFVWHGFMPRYDPPPRYWYRSYGWPVLRLCRCRVQLERCKRIQQLQRKVAPGSADRPASGSLGEDEYGSLVVH